ncbi:MAG TPA: NACHT domain-containing protein [Polyangiaceae bacterium]|nr:NACHT domain-containing protein [Polyangiaceae bacterium]
MASVLPPGWLDTPPTSRPGPPVVSTKQGLRFGELSWPDFERLCLRMARRESDVEDARLYGIAGQDQEGIDLFARLRAGGGYRVYQCKRVQKFTASRIGEAVDEFVAGSWYARATEFCLCTTETLSEKARAEAVVAQQARLAADGKRLVVWDAESLSEQLKALPDLVDDFFSREWVVAFNGRSAAESLGQRLSKTDAVELRTRLARLYYNMFSLHDPGFRFRDPTAPSQADVTLPEILDWQTLDEPDESTGSQPSTAAASDALLDPDSDGDDWQIGQPSAAGIERRSPAEGWLSASDRSLIVGGPGAGKSTLLRVIALDLMSVEPMVAPVAQRWGSSLPVWIPFGRWTQLLDGSGTPRMSLREFLGDWLRLHSEADLIPLVERALDDSRLLLLVDGLDEWSSQLSGATAFDLLSVFVRQRSVPVIATGRPHAIESIGQFSSDWQVGAIAPLSNKQQRQIAQALMEERQVRHLADRGIEQKPTASLTEQFLREIWRSAELGALAVRPLILNLLVQLWYDDAVLPDNRFKAYEKLVEQLLITHPARRNRAAQRSTENEDLSTESLREALSWLALQVQEHWASGSIPRSSAQAILEDYLRDEDDGLGLSKADAKRSAARILSYATDSAGLLVSRSPADIGFYHRALQEYLAAEALSRRPTAVRIELVRTFAGDPRWHETLVGLVWLTRSKQDALALIEVIRDAPTTRLQRMLALPMLAEIALNAPNCPSRVAREVASEVLDAIETQHYLPIRLRLLDIAVRGLRAGPTQEQLRVCIARWLPRRDLFRESLYETIGAWPRTLEATECLRRGLAEERAEEARSAARALAEHARTDSSLRDDLVARAADSDSARTRASILDGLLEAGVELSEPEIDQIAGPGANLELEFVAIKARVKRGTQTESDLENFLKFGNWGAGLDSGWRGQIPGLVVSRWGQSTELKRACMTSLVAFGSGLLEPELARITLARGFLSDPEVQELFAAEIKAGRMPFDRELWPIFAEVARGAVGAQEGVALAEGPILEAIEAWLPGVEHDQVNAHWAALTARTPKAKATMLARLDRAYPSWAARALLLGWGMQDEEVARALLQMANGDPVRTGELASLLPSILVDTSACRARLLELLACADVKRPDLVLVGLSELRSGQAEPDVVTLALPALERLPRGLFGWHLSELAPWGDDARVASLALQELDRPEGEMTAVAKIALRAPELREPLLRRIGVLPVALRTALSERLRGASDPVAVEALALYGLEWEGQPRAQSAIGHYSAMTSPPASTLEKLAVELRTRGSIHERYHEAALCGLLQLDRLDVFADAKDMEHLEQPLSFRLGWSTRFNPVFWRELVEHWSSIRRALGQGLVPRLVGDGDARDFWDKVSCFARPGTEVATDLLTYIESLEPGTGLTLNTIRFVERAGVRRDMLRETCLRAVQERSAMSPRSDAYDYRSIACAEILGRTFAAEDDVLAQIVKGLPADEILLTPSAVSLCTGWAASDALHEIFLKLREKKSEVGRLLHATVVATKSNTERAVGLFENFHKCIGGMRHWETTAASKFVARRLRGDEEVFDELMLRVTGDKLDHLDRITAIRLLAMARGVPPALRTLVEAMAEREVSGKVTPKMFIDPLSGRVRPVSHALLDMIA